MSTPRAQSAAWRRARTAGILVALGVGAWFLTRSVGAQWTQFRAVATSLRPRWLPVFGASALVLATYALLVQSWRALVSGWGGHLAYWTGVRIWTVSNLARYIPGSLWSVGAIGLMAEAAGVPPAAAAGAAILNTLVNLAAGFVIVAVAGGDYVGQLAPGVPYPRLVGAALGLAGALALPICLPLLTSFAARVLRREQPARLPRRTLLAVFAANLLAWVGYGLAFGWFARALLPTAGDNWAGYITVFTGSYLAGFLAIFAPSGLFVREAAMVLALTGTGLATPVDATLLAVAQRLWLTVLEVVPGLTFLAAGAFRRRSAPAPATSK